MAEKKAEKGKEKEAAPAEGDAKAKKSLPKGVIIAIIVGGAIVLQSAIFMVVLSKMKAKTEVTEEQIVADSLKKVEAEKAKLPPVDSTKLIYKVEDIIVNPMDGGRRLLALSIILEYKTEAFAATAKAKDGQIRDAFSKTLGSKPIEELANVLNRDHLRRELLKAVNESYGDEVVVKLFFSNFVIQ
jgi:flagellar basal body-associated protein FliL